MNCTGCYAGTVHNVLYMLLGRYCTDCWFGTVHNDPYRLLGRFCTKCTVQVAGSVLYITLCRGFLVGSEYNILYTVQATGLVLYIMHFTLYRSFDLYCALYKFYINTIHNVLYRLLVQYYTQCTVQVAESVLCILYVLFTLQAIGLVLYIFIECTLYRLLGLYCTQCTVQVGGSVLYRMYCAGCWVGTVHNVLYRLVGRYCTQCTV